MAVGDRHAVLTLDQQHSGTTGSLGPARAAVSRFLTGSEVGRDAAERAALIVSELTTNAVNASPGLDYRLVVTVDSDLETLTIRVENQSPWRSPPARADWGPEHLLAPRGRGLAIVETLADRVAFGRSGSTVDVTAEIRLSQLPPAR